MGDANEGAYGFNHIHDHSQHAPEFYGEVLSRFHLAFYLHFFSQHESAMLSEITGAGAAHRHPFRSTF